MRSISIRQFQQHFHSELASLPFQVTKRGTPIFNVVTINDSLMNVVTSPQEVVEKVQEKRPDWEFCKHGRRKDLCEKGCV